MAIVIPFSKSQPSALAGSGTIPTSPSDPFALMAAAQMKSDRKSKTDGKAAD